MATSYAEFSDVAVRAGRWQSLFAVDGKHPNVADVEQLLADCAAEVDTAVQARGFTPGTLDPSILAAFRDIVAFGALARAVAAIPDSPKELETLRAYAMAVWAGAMGDPAAAGEGARRGSISTGTFPAIAALEAGAAGGGAGPGIFQADEPDYGSPEQVEAEAASLTLSLAPAFGKGQAL